MKSQEQGAVSHPSPERRRSRASGGPTELGGCHVEAVGIPGSGKSTVLSAAIDALRESGVSVLSRKELEGLYPGRTLRQRARRASSLPKILARQADFSRAVLRDALQVRPFDPVRLRRCHMLLQRRYAIYHTRPSSSVTVLDQGLLQDLTAVSLMGHSSSSHWTQSTVDLLFRDLEVLVLYFQTRIDTSMMRIRNRDGHTIFDRANPLDVRRILEATRLDIESVVESVRSRAVVVNLDAGLPVPELANAVLDSVLRFLAGAHPGADK